MNKLKDKIKQQPQFHWVIEDGDVVNFGLRRKREVQPIKLEKEEEQDSEHTNNNSSETSSSRQNDDDSITSERVCYFEDSDWSNSL